MWSSPAACDGFANGGSLSISGEFCGAAVLFLWHTQFRDILFSSVVQKASSFKRVANNLRRGSARLDPPPAFMKRSGLLPPSHSPLPPSSPFLTPSSTLCISHHFLRNLIRGRAFVGVSAEGPRRTTLRQVKRVDVIRTHRRPFDLCVPGCAMYSVVPTGPIGLWPYESDFSHFPRVRSS